ncbi:HU family DNA-binding protein, partial [Stenotrophomonas sp. NPDC077659]|uniref:HU family DNA-binding protein n=1 Tax=Stenotrophomonas sp. NPDC077659 TaxID=3390694 RepID=UPI003D0730D3
MALTKAEMAEKLFDEVGLNKREAKEFVDAFFDVLREPAGVALLAWNLHRAGEHL